MGLPELLDFAHVSLLGVVEVFENAFQNIKSSTVGVKASSHLRHAAGKTVLITGGTSGIGEYTAKSLLQHGANVVITSRSLPRAESAAKRIAAELDSDSSGHAQVRCMKLDLGNMEDVRQCAERAKKMDDIDVLICNAGIMCPLQRTLTDDNMEVQFQTNHLGHSVLASELAAHRVRQVAAGHSSKPLRVVLVSSVAARAGNIDWDDLQAKQKYVPFRAYAQSKLANIMCAVELQRRCDALRERLRPAAARGPSASPPTPLAAHADATAPQAHGTSGAANGAAATAASAAVTCTSMHPGLVNTPLARSYLENDYIAVPWLRPVLAPVLRAVFPLMLLRPELSVQPVALAALGPPAEVRCRFVEGRRALPVFRAARSTGDCARLWDESLRLAGQADPCI
eukprot:jgi/Ulvmu1/642/UM010_0012.1